jgi:MFS-type transporter involved in bile tolerance (Atg22 family)
MVVIGRLSDASGERRKFVAGLVAVGAIGFFCGGIFANHTTFLIVALGQFGGIVSPVMVGRIKDLTGSTTPALYVIGVCALIAVALLMWGLPQKLRTLDKY